MSTETNALLSVVLARTLSTALKAKVKDFGKTNEIVLLSFQVGSNNFANGEFRKENKNGQVEITKFEFHEFDICKILEKEIPMSKEINQFLKECLQFHFENFKNENVSAYVVEFNLKTKWYKTAKVIRTDRENPIIDENQIVKINFEKIFQTK